MSAGLWAECILLVGPRPPQGKESEQDLYVKGWLSKVNNWATLRDLRRPKAIIHSFLLYEMREANNLIELVSGTKTKAEKEFIFKRR